MIGIRDGRGPCLRGPFCQLKFEERPRWVLPLPVTRKGENENQEGQKDSLQTRSPPSSPSSLTSVEVETLSLSYACLLLTIAANKLEIIVFENMENH